MTIARVFSVFAAAALALMVASCGAQNKANGFITENAPPPASAKQKDGDVPRDDYGRPYQYEMLGKALPEFTVYFEDGTALTRADLLGKWTILEVWGIWCPDCVVDGPNVQKLSERVASIADLDLVTVHAPPSAARVDEAFGKYGSVAAYFDAKDLSYPYAIDRNGDFKASLNLPWVPSFLLIDPDGQIRGYRSELSAAGNGAVEAFIKDVLEVKKQS
jgi:thiol-disulfide isomerase/thioredoxin